MQYEKRPDLVEAERWDGTVHGAVIIAKLLGTRYPAPIFHHRIGSDGVDKEPQLCLRLVPGLEENDFMYPNTWLIKDGREFTVLHEEAFRVRYQTPTT